LAVDFLAGLLFAVDRFAVDFFAVDFFAVDFFAVDFFAVDFLAVDRLAAVFLAVDFLAGLLLAVDFFAVDFFAGLFFAVVRLVVDEDAALAAVTAVATTAVGDFLAPDTTALRSAPARNFGTDVFFARILAPVCGLRTMRAGRIAFSNAPKPVMATFSPRATSRVM